MAQRTNDPKLLNQIAAGTKGRKKGHSYESALAEKLNSIEMPFNGKYPITSHLETGKAELILLNKILHYLKWESCSSLKAYSTGRLATAEDGDKNVTIDGVSISECKSDIIVQLTGQNNKSKIIGISVKQCNNKTPTNAQVFFTTASAFYKLIVDNQYELTEKALTAMKEFCGDEGFRPLDKVDCTKRISTPDRFFWEEIDTDGRKEWEELFKTHQDEVTRLLLQKGYKNDPFPPEIILHKTKKAQPDNEELALFSMDEFISLSHRFCEFTCSTYRVKKGSHKEPEGMEHLAPRFGIIQMQRGGQKQHPTQLQFNLKAGYFYKEPFSDSV